MPPSFMELLVFKGLLLKSPGWSYVPLPLKHPVPPGFYQTDFFQLSPATAKSDVIWWYPAARP